MNREKDEWTKPGFFPCYFIMMSSQPYYCTYHKHGTIAFVVDQFQSPLNLSFILPAEISSCFKEAKDTFCYTAGAIAQRSLWSTQQLAEAE